MDILSAIEIVLATATGIAIAMKFQDELDKAEGVSKEV